MQPPTFVSMIDVVTQENFDEVAYLAANHDVAECVASGQFKSGHDHFVQFGHAERRQMNVDPKILDGVRIAKFETLLPLLRRDMAVEWDGRKPNFLTEDLKEKWGISSTNNISMHNYDPIIMNYIYTMPGLLLDCGAGRRPTYFSNVVNFEIVNYDTTDVIGVGEELPFIDNSFSCVISVAVLEHVRDPFRCAKEIIRVLKPGGTLFCCAPLLAPLHAYPHHYYNMTNAGLRALFESNLKIESHFVGDSGHPIHALSWILRAWLEGLSAEPRHNFMERRVGDLLDPDSLLREPFCLELNDEKRFELALATILIGTKPVLPGW